MASFTDNSQALSQFNPYIQQVPTDDYIAVGLQKQQQYDQGVKAVQGEIDSVTSLPVIKQEQKDYLNSRINQLKTSISKVVGQDFSQSQLVNQIGGLTSQISSDPIIQSAVQSTIRYQNESSKMDDARKNGKSDPANEYVFQDSFQNWMNDKNVKSSFTGEYTPYIDVKSKLVKAINELHPTEEIQDLPFQMKDGQVVKDASGAPMIDSVMVAKMTKSLKPETIQAAIQSSLSEGDLNQLAINGRYEYRGVDKAGLKAISDASYNNRLGHINETLKAYAGQKLINPTDRAYQEDLDNKIKDLELHRDSLINQYPQDTKFLDQNPEAFKGELYKQNYLSNLTNGYAYSTNSLTYKDNPYFKAYLEKQKDARESAQFMAEYGPGGFKQQGLDIQRAHLQTELEIAAMRKSGKLDANGNPIPPPIGAPVQGDLNVAGVGPAPTIDTWAKTSADIGAAVEGGKRNLAANLFPDMMTVTRAPGQTSPTITYKDAASKAYVETQLAAQRDAWIKDPSSVSTAAATYFKANDDAQIRLDNRNAASAAVLSEANAATINPETIYNKIHGLVLSGPGLDNKSGYVSASDIATFQRKLNKVFVNPGYGGRIILDNRQADQVFSTPAERVLYNTYKKSYEGGDLTPAQHLIMDRLNEVNAATGKYSDALTARNQYANNRTQDLVQSEIPASFPINTAKKERENQLQGLTNNLVDNFRKQGAGEIPGGATTSNIAKLYKAAGTTFSLEAQGHGQFALKLSNSGADLPAQSIPLTQDQVNQYFPEANINQFSAVNEALALTKNLVTPTTDVQNKGAQTAFVLQNPYLNQYSVKYHVEEPNRDGKYQIKAYVLDRSKSTNPSTPPTYTEIPVPLPSLLGEEGLSNFIANFGDDDIKRLLAPKK